MAFPSTNSVKLNELKEKSVFRKKISIFVCLRESCLPSVHITSLHVYSWESSLMQSKWPGFWDFHSRVQRGSRNPEADGLGSLKSPIFIFQFKCMGIMALTPGSTCGPPWHIMQQRDAQGGLSLESRRNGRTIGRECKHHNKADWMRRVFILTMDQ